MTVEFYGEISENTLRSTEKLKSRYFAQALLFLTMVLLVAALVSMMFHQTAFYVLLIFSVILGVLSMVFYSAPGKKKIKNRIKARVTVNDDGICWTQLINGKEIQVKKHISEIKKVWRTKYCYYLIYRDISNAIICETQLMRGGSLEYFESLFAGKIRNKSLN